ncbi:hypothetical protein [Ulvibacterium marinum]|uniref:Alpha/beta hydrolase n=1 Tax=Ulvibacterium marinum TaxID=2419782 RepID=A0A3B0C4W2_9FLAO|nr:hypothetical protein [Ulvibacterium marinum]RKN81315.1 hypothetical protein D7Z94_10280 [Ulvibacterium marinum]
MGKKQITWAQFKVSGFKIVDLLTPALKLVKLLSHFETSVVLMKRTYILAIVLFFGCKEKNKDFNTEKGHNKTIIADTYELIKSNDSRVLLIVFPGGGATSKETKENFNIVENATGNSFSVLLMNFNRHLWINEEDSEKLSADIKTIIEQNDLNTEKIFIGGISIGGTVAITIANYLSKSNSSIEPNGVFVVDSPIDLYALYQSSQKDILRKDFSEERLSEPKFIIRYFEEEFGRSDTLLTNIQKVSPITLQTRNTTNIKNLKNKKLRFYTEPDTLWWKENRQTDFESTNAYMLQKTFEILKSENWNNVQLVQTENKGFRANGKRHPHSWSIVDTDDLIEWILE